MKQFTQIEMLVGKGVNWNSI